MAGWALDAAVLSFTGHVVVVDDVSPDWLTRRAARHLVPDGRGVWAQIAPGNAASVRTFLAAGSVRWARKHYLLITDGRKAR